MYKFRTKKKPKEKKIQKENKQNIIQMSGHEPSQYNKASVEIKRINNSGIHIVFNITLSLS